MSGTRDGPFDSAAATITSTPRFEGRIVKVSVDEVLLPNGTRTELEVVRHPGGAVVVAVDGAQRVCLLRQYRYVAGGWIWELPAGKLEPGEPPLATAKRELAEEAGVRARSWSSLGAYLSSPGVFSEVLHLYLATDLEPVPARPEANEVFETHWTGLDEARLRALSGEIRDGKTALGLLRAAWRFAAGAVPPGG